MAVVPYRIRTVLTDNPVLSDCRRQAVEGGIQFTNHAHHKYAFHRVCDENGSEHRLTKGKAPVDQRLEPALAEAGVNRTIKDATVKRYHYDSHDRLRQHLADFVAAYDFDRRLKTLKGLAPYEAICKAWQNEPERFTSNPHQQMPGPNI